MVVSHVNDMKRAHPEEMAALLATMTNSLEAVEAQLDSVHLEASRQVARIKAEKAEVELQLAASERARVAAEQASRLAQTGSDDIYVQLAAAKEQVARLAAENAQLAELCGARLSELGTGQDRLGTQLTDLRALAAVQFPPTGGVAGPPPLPSAGAVDCAARRG